MPRKRNTANEANVFDVENLNQAIGHKVMKSAKKEAPVLKRVTRSSVSSQSASIPSTPIRKSARTIRPSCSSSPRSIANSSATATPRKRRLASPKSDQIFIPVEVDEDDLERLELYKMETKKTKPKTKVIAKAAPVKKSRKKTDRTERIAKLFKSGAVVEPLPGRSEEFDWIKRTVSGLLESGLGGCLCKKG